MAAKLREKKRSKLTEEETKALDFSIFEICNANQEDAVMRMRKALDQGADVHYQDEAGDTPLHYCALEGNIDTVRMLIEAGADVNAPNQPGSTPYMYAEANQHGRVLLLLKKYGGRPGENE